MFVSGDIGCYTLGAMPPFNAMQPRHLHGREHRHGPRDGQEVDRETAADKQNRVVSVIGDSTFFHSGITGAARHRVERGNTVTIILDNRTTAMTGGQENPGHRAAP